MHEGQKWAKSFLVSIIFLSVSLLILAYFSTPRTLLLPPLSVAVYILLLFVVGSFWKGNEILRFCFHVPALRTSLQSSGASLQRFPMVDGEREFTLRKEQFKFQQKPLEVYRSRCIAEIQTTENSMKTCQVMWCFFPVVCRRSLGLDKTTILIVTDPGSQHDVQQTPLRMCQEVFMHRKKMFCEYSKRDGKFSLTDNAVKSTSFTLFVLMSKRYKVQQGSGYFSIFLTPNVPYARGRRAGCVLS